MKYLLSIRFLRTILILLPLLFYGFNSNNSQQKVLEKNGTLYLSNTIILKLKSSPSTDGSGNVILSSNLAQFLKLFSVKESKLLFPEKLNKNSEISRIVLVHYEDSADPFYVSSKINSFSEIEWAEPKFVYEFNFTPNDPSYNLQYGLTRINAAQAWDISQGDTTISIGIVDTGVDWDHPDLAANIWRNWNEIPNNGIDDDNNGFIDDIRGWDFGGLNGTPDNDPMEDQPDHGTHVAGIASAVTNNGIGVASIGFKCKIMAIKTSRNDLRGPNGPYIIFGYEGIVYAANNGARVINCSWGGSGFSMFGQEIINYAISKNSLVVCAAGNSNSSEPFYPASYKGALSVASTTNTDARSSFSNFGKTIDVSAPGNNIYNTWQNNTYATLSGTSMASPLTAGLAGLVVSRFPQYNAIQIGEQIRVNCDDINSVNPSFQFLLGNGRINAFKSLNNTNSKSVRAIDLTFSDEQPGGNGDGIFQSGETITVSAVFVNYLSPTSNLTIQLESRTSYSTVLSGTFNVGAVNTLQQFNNQNNKFTFRISNTTPQNALVNFLIRYTDGSYADFQWIEVIANPTYATQSGNNVKLTITSKGTLAFNDYPTNSQGQGFKYNDSNNQLFEGALILGTSAERISDAARGANQSVQNNDFAVVQPFTLKIPGSIADVEGNSVFNDNNAGTNKIGITSKLKSYSFSQSPYENFIILDYTFINNGTTQINNLFTGLFFDWDMVDGNGDVTNWDNNVKYGITRNTANPSLNWVGVGLISAENFGFYAIKNDSGDGGFGIYDGFADHEKWLSISSGVSKQNAGPGDVSQVVASGPYSINPGDSIRVAFAIAGGMNKQSLDLAIQNARVKYQQILTNIKDESVDIPSTFKLDQNYPNPFGNSIYTGFGGTTDNLTTKISWQQPKGDFISIKLYNSIGEELETIVEGFFESGSHSKFYQMKNSLPSGIYFYQLRSGNFTETKKMVFIR